MLLQTYTCEKLHLNTNIGKKYIEWFFLVILKLWRTDMSRENVVAGLKKSLKDLELPYVDLYLIHWPTAFQVKYRFLHMFLCLHVWFEKHTILRSIIKHNKMDTWLFEKYIAKSSLVNWEKYCIVQWNINRDVFIDCLLSQNTFWEIISFILCFFLQQGEELLPRDSNGELICATIDYLDTWKGMEECLKLGLTKAIGLSNFNSKQIQRILDNSSVLNIS